MAGICHHVPDTLLLAYAAGSLPRPHAVVVAAHVSMCDDCRAGLAAHDDAGGACLEGLEAADLSGTALDALMDRLDDATEEVAVREPTGIYPSPVVDAMSGRSPRWRSLGGGARQDIISYGAEGSLRLLSIPAGKPVPEHGHQGLELTLILQGSFSDKLGRFARGDLEVADGSIEHQPHADPGDVCICLAATSAPLRFTGWLPRVLQPLFRI